MPNSKCKEYGDWLKVSANCRKGKIRQYMEDKFLIRDFSFNNHQYYFFIVFDGHGGSEAVDFSYKHIIKYFKKCLTQNEKKKTKLSIKNCLSETFQKLNDSVTKYHWAGTTISLILIDENQETKQRVKYVANVGDSTIFGVKKEGNSVRKLSFDHKPSVKRELKRLETFDNFRKFDGSYVLFDDNTNDDNENLGLAMTRAIGDSSMGEGISCKPFIRCIKSHYDIIMIASDGIWDVWNGRGVPVWNKLKDDILINDHSWQHSAKSLNNWRNKNFEQHDNTSLILMYLA
jgi:serine/threonine protein phosphatase PrpC